jgi:hypothetical protein
VQGSGPVGLVDRETLRDQLDGRTVIADLKFHTNTVWIVEEDGCTFPPFHRSTGQY